MLKRKSTGVTFAVGILCVAMAMAQNNPAEDSWPAQVDSGGSRITIYQPQAESWKKNRLEARAAVTVLRSGTGMPLYGIVNISARTEVDKESRLVTLADLKIDSVSFPAAQASQSDLLRDLRASLGEWPQIISLDRLLADLSITDAEREVDSAPLKNDLRKSFSAPCPPCSSLLMANRFIGVWQERHTRASSTLRRYCYSIPQPAGFIWMAAGHG